MLWAGSTIEHVRATTIHHTSPKLFPTGGIWLVGWPHPPGQIWVKSVVKDNVACTGPILAFLHHHCRLSRHRLKFLVLNLTWHNSGSTKEGFDMRISFLVGVMMFSLQQSDITNTLHSGWNFPFLSQTQHWTSSTKPGINMENSNGDTMVIWCNYYSMSNVILVDEKFTLFHQYLRCRHRSGTIVFSIPGVISWA